MAAVGTEYIVVDTQEIGLAHSGSFLPDRQVGRAGIIIFHFVVSTGGFHQVEHGFKFPDVHHVPVDADEILGGVVGLFFFDRLVVLVHGDVLEFDDTALPHFLRTNKLAFWHRFSLLCLN